MSDDPPPVGLFVRSGLVGAVGVHHLDLIIAVAEGLEGDAPAIGRPGGRAVAAAWAAQGYIEPDFSSPMTFPSGSANIAISGPPGISIGGIVVLPPKPSIFSKWAFKSGTST